METTPFILKVTKMEDGVVQQVCVDKNGTVAETYFKNPRGDKVNLTDPYAFDDFYFNTEAPPSHPNKRRCKRALYKFFSVTLSTCLYFCLTALYIFYFNPVMQTHRHATFKYGYILPYEIARPNKDALLKRCDENIFCEMNYIALAINTSSGTMYPNFTKTANGSNSSGDYYDALWQAAAILENSSCKSTFTVINNSGNSSSNVSDNTYNFVKMNIYSSIFLLQTRCHYEAVYALNSPKRFSMYNLNFKNYLKLPGPISCNQSWESVFNKSYTPVLQNSTCSSNYSEYNGILNIPVMLSF
ncbi:hypothetical protein KM481_gp23 [Harp seal herpesvirus]|uniref:Uncharacterized protein n=1 Tax=phocid gammaherpesvirus 3 TaxID=2560643 RepID=A0A0R5YD67_9GAMA|nr:hypothetical protein KM481_gp23 [Harp seal herpesvirus]AJG42953.1 hypothetical protein [Harp seal herpesvirus]